MTVTTAIINIFRNKNRNKDGKMGFLVQKNIEK